MRPARPVVRGGLVVGALIAFTALTCAFVAAPRTTPSTLDYVATTHAVAGPTRATTLWCGTEERSYDRPDLTSGPTIHVLYAIPSDGEDRFAEKAPLIAADIEAITAWWQSQDPARVPRFDLAASTTCPTGVELDLGFLRLPQTGDAYRSSETLRPLDRDVLAFVEPDEKMIVLFDGERSEPDICGTSPIAASFPGALGTSFVWGRSSCEGDLGAGGIAAAAMAHELTHSLGAVPLEGPPNRCRDGTRSGHVCDDPSDLMYPFASRGLGQVTLDTGRNDYYGHPGMWWDVADSRWLVHYPLRRIVVAVVGAGGTGLVRTDAGGVECHDSCAVTVEDGTTVHLDAIASSGSRLYGWSGACNGTASGCSTTVTTDTTVSARFGAFAHRVTVTVKAGGRVTGLGTACPGTSCAAWVRPGSALTLVARPAAGWRFARWTGTTCSPTVARCVLRPARDLSVGATFARR